MLCVSGPRQTIGIAVGVTIGVLIIIIAVNHLHRSHDTQETVSLILALFTLYL